MEEAAFRPDTYRAAGRAATGRHAPAAGWWALATTFGALVAWPHPGGQPDELASPRPQRPVVQPNQVAIQRGTNDAESSRTILARPLFEPGRRPAPPAAAPEAQAAPAAALPRLSGTIIGANGYRAAMLVPADGPAITVREGDRAGGLRILQISPGQIVAENANGRLSLSIRYDTGPAPAAPPPLVKPVRIPVGFATPTQDPRERAPGDQDE